MKRIGWFVAFLCLSASMALAQNAQLSGVVKDKTGAVVPQAEVTLKNVDTEGTLQTKTSKVGFFVFPSVQPGKYDLSAVAKGFDETVVNGIKVDTAANVSQDLILRIKQGADTVTVVQREELNTTDGTVSTVISHQFIENLPLNGNDLTTLFELTPGTLLNAGGDAASGGGFSVDGQRPTANYVTVDGASGEAYIPTTSSSVNNNTGAGIATSATGGTNGILPIDAIEEYRMDTATYTAENGRTPGGQIQVRTRGGTNKFHGTLFEDLRNQVFNANDWFSNYDDLKQTPLRMNEFGGTLGGPILKNKFFFFIADDNLLLDQPETATKSKVPDASVSLGAYPVFKNWLSIFPSGNGGQIPNVPSFDYYSASYPDLDADHTTSGRLDCLFPKSIHAFFRANIAPSSSTTVTNAVEGLGAHITIDTFTGGVTVPIGAHMVNDFTINRTEDNTKYLYTTHSVEGNNPNGLRDNLPDGVNASSDEFTFEPSIPSFSDKASSSIGPAQRNELHQWNIVDTFALHRGKNTLKFGLDFLTRKSILQAAGSVYTVYVFTANSPPYNNTDIDTGTISQFEQQRYIAYPTVALYNTSLFVNDDWKASPSLTINAGVRWELNPAPMVGPLGAISVVGSNLNPASFEDALSTKPLYKTVYNNFAPRFGFAWNPDSNSGTAIRGGVGIYFDTGQAASVAGTYSSESYPYIYTYKSNEVPYASVNWVNSNGTQGNVATSPLYLVNPHLLSPRTSEWSLTFDQTFRKYAKINMSYVGNDGEKLVGLDQYFNGQNSSGQYPVNTTYVTENGNLYIATNQSHSNYQALQAQLTSTLGQRFTALISYTWSHAEDNGSSDFSSVGAAAPNRIANSANDIPQMFAAAIHYAPKGLAKGRVVRGLTSGWEFDTIARLQSASPLTVEYESPGDNLNNFTTNADVIPGVPTILHEHIDSYGNVVPGNRLLNWAAFTSPPLDTTGNQIRNGDSPTNGYRLFGLKQWDIAASRSWKLWEHLNLKFRVDAYNILNAANFDGQLDGNNVWNSFDESSFGMAAQTYAGGYGGTVTGTTGEQQSIFQNGGPRELQLSIKLSF